MTTYSFRFSKLVMVITGLGLIALSALLYHLITSEDRTIYNLIGWASVLALFYPIVSMPIHLIDNGDTLIIRRLLYSERYSRSECDISYTKELNLKGSLRVFGSGGYFGFFGVFWKPNHGLFKLIQTEPSKSFIKIKKKNSSHALYIAYK